MHVPSSLAALLLATLCPWPEVQPLDQWTDGLFCIELAKPNGAMASASATDDWQTVREWHRATIGPHGERTVEVEYEGCLSGSWRLRGDRPLRVVVTVTQTAKRIEYSLSTGGTADCRLQRAEFPRLAIGPGIGLGLPPGARYLRSNRPPGAVVVWPAARQDSGAEYTTGRVTLRRVGGEWQPRTPDSAPHPTPTSTSGTCGSRGTTTLSRRGAAAGSS